MIEHFDAHLNLRRLILERRPGLIVECGAGNGETTRLLAHMKLFYPFELVSITDKVIDGIDEVDWQIGLSYERLKNFEDNSIGLCILDTDHNFWTLEQELETVKGKMMEGGLVVMHDVETFYHDNGMAMAYWDGQPYPEKEISGAAIRGGLGDALLEFLVKNKMDYKLLWYTPESNGCAVIERKTVTQSHIIKPGPGAVFAPLPK